MQSTYAAADHIAERRDEMNVLIIGGAGFLGANLARTCLTAGARVTILDSLESRLDSTTANLRAIWDHVRFVQGSMADGSSLPDVIDGQDVIFNCAGQTSHPLSLQDPLYDLEINCVANLKLLETLRGLKSTARIVYASTSTIVGRAPGEVVDEDHGERPLDIYSANKGAAEKYYRIYHHVFGLRTLALRFANLYGPYGKGSPEFGFINHFIAQAWSGNTIRIFGDGLQTRNALYVEDAAEAMLVASSHDELLGETHFVVHDEHLPVRRIAEEIVDVLGRGSIEHIGWSDERMRIELDQVLISGRRFREATGWSPRHSFREGMERTRAVLARTEVL
jgi:UDP-glucose 4-epimerase